MKYTTKIFAIAALLCAAAQPVSAAIPGPHYYTAATNVDAMTDAHVLKVGIDSTHCDANVCRIYVYFDRDLELAARSADGCRTDRAVLYLHISPSSPATAMDDLLYKAVMQAYLTKDQVRVGVVPVCDPTVNMVSIASIEQL